MIDTNTWQTAVSLQNFNVEIPIDDNARIELVQDYVAGHIDKHWLESLTSESSHPRRLSPPAFRYQLTERARKANNVSFCQKVKNHVQSALQPSALNVVLHALYCWVTRMKSAVLQSNKA